MSSRANIPSGNTRSDNAPRLRRCLSLLTKRKLAHLFPQNPQNRPANEIDILPHLCQTSPIMRVRYTPLV